MATTTSTGSTASHPKSRFLSLEDTRTRLGIIERALVTLHENNTQEVRTSRFFYWTYGGQQETDRFTQIFLDFFAYIRGEETLALEGAFKLLSCFGRERIDRPSSHFFLVPDDPLHYSAQPFFRDVYHEYAQYHTNHDYPKDVIVGNHAVESGYVKCMYPTEPVKKQLKTLLEKHQGLYRDFLLLLKKEHRALNLSAKIEDREIIFQPQEETISSITTDILTGLTFFLGSVTLFPKLGDTLKCIYARLLAIQWLKEDQRQLKQELGENVPPLKIPFTPNFPVIIDGTRYVICPTSPDGACALHALLGEKVDGEYRFRGDVRKHFIDTLKAKRQDPQIQSLFKRILKNHLHNAIDGRDLSSQMLFSDTPEGFRDAYYLLCSPFPLAIQLINAREAHLWAGEMDHNAFIREKLIQIAQQRREFSGKKSPEIVAKLKEDPFLLLNLIHPERTDFLNLLRHPAKKHFLTLLALEKEQVLASQSKKQDDFVLSDQIFERYLETVNQETFFFNTEEIELAAYLFGKKVQILALNGGSLQFSEYLFNPDLLEETTYIFHSGNHFSRCIPSNEISLAELNSLYNQAKGAAVVQRNKDERAEKILISTIKQELPRLGFSYGVSWIIGPAPMISQSINSAVTITSTYLDPFKESPLSAVTQVSASPILQLATGNSYAYVATSLSVDLGGRMFFDSLEERDMPEGFQRYALAAAKGFILRDEDILLSGLFNATVGLGMDQFRNRWESYFELNEAYWASDPAWGHCIVKGLWTTHCLQESLGSWLKQTADAFIKEDHPPIPRVFEISYSEGGTHLLTPLGEKTWSYEVRETWDTEHNSWTGKDKKINERLSIFHIQKDASGNSIETKLGSVPNQAIGLAMIKLHEQAWNSYADFHEAASAFQQTLIDMGIPPGAIPPIQGLTQVHISIDFPSGSGKAKSYVTTVAGTTTWEIEEKHKGNRPLKILEIHGVDPNKTHNQTTLKEYISQLKNLFGLEITTAPSHPLSLYSPFVEQEGKTYHVTGIGEHGEVLKLSKTTDSEEATVMSNRLVTFNAKVIEQNKQCMEMEQRLIDAGIPETSRPTFPQLETKPHKAGDFEVSYAQINASNIRNTQATTNYISQGNKLLDTPFEPQSLTPQQKQALIDSFSPHIPPEPTPLGFGEAVALGLKKVSTFLTDIGVESAQVSTSIPLYSAPKTSSPTFSENQIDLALSGGTPSQIVGHVTREGATFRTPPTPSPSSAQAPSPIWTWEDLQAYEAASLFQTLNSRLPPQPSSTSPPSFDPTQVDAQLRESWGAGVVDPSPSSITLPSMQTAGFAPTLTSPILASLFPVMDPSILMHSTEENQKLHIALNNDFVKSIPKGVGKVAVGILKFMVPDMSDFPDVENPHEHIDRACQFLEIRYDELVHMEDPNSFAAKAGVFVGEIGALGSVGKLVRLAELPALFSTISEGAVVGAIIAEADNHDPLQGAVTGAAIGGSLHKVIGWLHLPSSPKSSEMILEFRPSLFPPKAEITSIEGRLASKVSSTSEKSAQPRISSRNVYAPESELPRHPIKKEPFPDTDAPHTQLGSKQGRNGNYPQAREFDAQGKPVRDIDFTDHGRAHNHPNPHQHKYKENTTGGTLTRNKKPEPLQNWEYE